MKLWNAYLVNPHVYAAKQNFSQGRWQGIGVVKVHNFFFFT